MAITIETNTTRSITLEEYCEHVGRNVDTRDIDSVVASAVQLRELANNPKFLVEKFNAELLNWRNDQQGGDYSPQTLALARGNGWYARANLWVPPPANPKAAAWHNRIFSYWVPHDHNFTFLTAGYFGPGYETDIYEYDPDRVTGKPGERVGLRLLEHTSLPAGKVMLYRASRDVHVQYHPSAFSMSLNFMLTPPDLNLTNQYFFDVGEGRITGCVENSSSGRILLCQMAKFVGDGATVNILEEQAVRHPMPRVRAACLESLAHLEPAEGARVWRQGLSDGSEFVREVAASQLGAMASGEFCPSDFAGAD